MAIKIQLQNGLTNFKKWCEHENNMKFMNDTGNKINGK